LYCFVHRRSKLRYQKIVRCHKNAKCSNQRHRTVFAYLLLRNGYQINGRVLKNKKCFNPKIWGSRLYMSHFKQCPSGRVIKSKKSIFYCCVWYLQETGTTVAYINEVITAGSVGGPLPLHDLTYPLIYFIHVKYIVR
jgi:hypothetical protein